MAKAASAVISSPIRRIRSRSCWPPQANQLWSWDITKLRGPVKWTCYHLYVILDVFSRYVVGWMIAYRESAELAKRLIDHSCRAQTSRPANSPSTPIAARR